MAAVSPCLKPNSPVMACWTCAAEEGAARRPAVKVLGHKFPEPKCNVVMDATFDAAGGAAFFKLRVPVPLKALPDRTTLYLFIRPEDMVSIQAVSDPAAVPQAVVAAFVRSHGKCASAADIRGLRFELRQPAAAIGPAGATIAARPKFERLVELLRSLARATCFTVYFPADVVLSQSRLDALCAAACDGGLKSLPAESSLQRLYAGKGGVVLGAEEGEHEEEEELPESPPSYDEIGLSPPPPPARRLRDKNSPPPSGQPPEKKQKGKAAETVQYQDGWRKVIEGQLDILRKRVDDMSRSEAPADDVKGQLQQVQGEIEALRAQLVQVEKGFNERLEQMEARWEERFAELKQEMEDELEERAEELRGEMSEHTEERIDERVLDMKEELTDHVKEELKNVEETIKEDLKQDMSRAMFSVEFHD